jgi:tetratricopeptide (TPR) repeat protein
VRYFLLLPLLFWLLLPVHAQEATAEPTVTTALPESTAEPVTILVPPVAEGGVFFGDDEPPFRCLSGSDAFARHVEQGALNRGRQRMKDAYNNYNCAVEIDPLSALAYRGRGIAYAAMGSYEQALLDYDQAIEIDPRDPLVYFQRGLALHQISDDLRALDALSEAIRLDPGYALAFNWRGIVHRDLGDLEKAIQDFQIAIALGIPDQIFVPYVNLGNLYLNQQDNPQEAVRWYEEAARLVPGQAFVYELLGDTYLKMGRLGDAEENYELYIKVTNTAKESVRSLVEAAGLRQFVLRYLPSVIIAVIVGYFALLAGLRRWSIRQALQRARQQIPAVLTPATPIPGAPPSQLAAPDDAADNTSAGWLAVAVVPLLAGVAYLLRRLASSSDEPVAGH